MRITSAATSTRTNQNANIRCQQVDNNFSPPTQSSCEGAEDGLSKQHSLHNFEGWYCSPRAWGLSGAATGFAWHLQEDELPISVGSTSEWLTLLHQRPNLRKIYSEQICSFWMSSAVRISWCSMCGSKFSWPPHCPQCSDWWEWKLFHVSLRPGSELLPWLAPQQYAPSQWY